MDIPAIDIAKIEQTLTAGRQAVMLERARHAAFVRAKAVLEQLLRSIAGAAGGIRGTSATRVGGVLVIYPDEHNQDLQIVANTGELKGCAQMSHLQAVWLALPIILDEHIAACEFASAAAAAQCDNANALSNGIEAVSALLQVAAPLTRKRALVKRVFEDAEMQAALGAAISTEDPHAIAKLMHDQVDDSGDGAASDFERETQECSLT